MNILIWRFMWVTIAYLTDISNYLLYPAKDQTRVIYSQIWKRQIDKVRMDIFDKCKMEEY